MSSDRIKWIEYKGKSILYIDYSHLSKEKLQPVLDEVTSIVPHEPPHSIRICINVEDMKYDTSIIGQFNSLVSNTRRYVLARAIIGIKDVPTKIMFDSVIRLTGLETETFFKMNDALDWLTEKTI